MTWQILLHLTRQILLGWEVPGLNLSLHPQVSADITSYATVFATKMTLPSSTFLSCLLGS
jgi:hypothetical protein